MTKVELQLTALSNSESHPGQFAMILEDVKMQRRIPVIIGATEAQAIAMVVVKMKPGRPQTHDTFYNTAKALGANLKEVIIHELIDNKYHTKLMWEKSGEITPVDSRTSDAVALAVRFECPIFIYEHLLEQNGFYVDTEGLPTERKGALINFPLSELEEMLEKVLKKEDFESASRIRDAIRKKRSQL